MSTSTWNRPSKANPTRRLEAETIPPEGENSLFTQSWFPICLAAEVPRGTIREYGFLGGRIVVFRGESGPAQVMSAFCPHMGASLGSGEVIGNNIRCAFHHWQYDCEGVCQRTGIGDAAPAAARLYKFVSQEKFGIVWAFNGAAPHYDIPDFPYPESELVIRAIALDGINPVDPWVQCANTPDIQHIKTLHHIKFTQDDPDDMEWTDHSLRYTFSGIHTDGSPVHNLVAIYGTSLYYQTTDYAGKWFGFLTPMGLPAPGQSKNFMVFAARKAMGTAEQIAGFLDFVEALEKGVVAEDLHVMASMKFRPGTLTKSDRTLSRFFSYMRAYPRANPAAPFI